jgi:hypothetical protein
VKQNNFDELAAAYERVKQAAAALCADYEQTCREIDAAEAELKELPLAPVPLDDMKEAILDFIDAAGGRYAESVRDNISGFANGTTAFGSVPFGSGDIAHKDVGKPISFDVLEGGLSGEKCALAGAQLLNPRASFFDDRSIYYFCGPLVREGLRKIMEKMGPAEFGYDRIHPDKIGSTRRERRAAIAALKERLGNLHSRKSDLAGKLAELGFSVPSIAKSKP